jgi:CO/xanthine dehydrogenase FAD-binding subunit
VITVSSYRKPGKLKEALDLLSSGEFTPIAGGTDLIPQLRDGRPRQLIDIGHLGLTFIKDSGDSIEIGAAATHSLISGDKSIAISLPLLSRATSLVGSWQIRNRGTVGGNIINASPCADSIPALLNYDAELVLKSKTDTRNISLDKFVTGPYKTLVRPDELLYSIKCNKPKGKSGHSYIKLGRRQAVNISRMTLAVTIVTDASGIIQKSMIAGGSIFPAPSRMKEIEKLLYCQKASAELFEQASNLAADLMLKESGYRWSTPYKKPVLMGLIQRALNEASRPVA